MPPTISFIILRKYFILYLVLLHPGTTANERSTLDASPRTLNKDKKHAADTPKQHGETPEVSYHFTITASDSFEIF